MTTRAQSVRESRDFEAAVKASLGGPHPSESILSEFEDEPDSSNYGSDEWAEDWSDQLVSEDGGSEDSGREGSGCSRPEDDSERCEPPAS